MDDISSKEILLQYFVCPLTETDALLAVDTKSYGYYHVKIIVVYVASHHAITLLANCSEIPNSCLLQQFLLLIDIGDVFAYIGFARPEQLHHLVVCKV